MLCVIEDAAIQSQDLAKSKPHEFYYVGRLKGRTIVYEHKESYYKSRCTNTVTVQKNQNRQYEVRIDSRQYPQPLLPSSMKQ